jgi:hypothetical protein
MLEIAIVLFGSLFSGFISGLSGGGGGMLMVPLMIFIGLPPQNAVATVKMNGLGAVAGGIMAFRKSGHIRMDIVKFMAPIAIAIGIATPFIFVQIDGEFMQRAIGIILLLLVPTTLMRKKVRPTLGAKLSKIRHVIGYGAYSVVLVLQALFGAGSGTLALYVQTLLLGTSKIEANATKRAVTAVLVPITFTALLIAGFVVLTYGIAAMVGAFIGTHFGAKMAIKKGDQFIGVTMAAIVSISAIVLIATA